MARKKKSDLPLAITIGSVTFGLITAIVAGAAFQQIGQKQAELVKADKAVAEKDAIARELFDRNTEVASVVLGENKLDDERLGHVKNLIGDYKTMVPDSLATNVKALLVEVKILLDQKNNEIRDARSKQELAENTLADEKSRGQTNQENAAREVEQLKSTIEVLQKEIAGVQSVHKEEVGRLKQAHNESYKKWKTDLDKQKTATRAGDQTIVKKDEDIAELQRLLKPKEEGPTTPNKRYEDKDELADGRIVSIDNELRLAVVNIGRNSGVKRGMQFNVFRDVGAAKRHLKGQVIIKKVYEHIAEAFVSYQRGLGQNFFLAGDFDSPASDELIQMVQAEGGRVVGEFGVTTNYLVIGNNAKRDIIKTAEELRIPVLRAHQVASFLTSPDRIKPGDVLINPAFSKTKKESFLLFGEFATPKTLLEQRISKYGSSTSSVTSPEEVTPGTDYLVVGARGYGELESSDIYKKANEYGITVIREEELLAFLQE